MKELKNKGINYFIDRKEVEAKIVLGPINFHYEFPEGQNPDIFLERALEQITTKAMDKFSLKNLGKKPDAYIYKGLTVIEPEQHVQDGKISKRSMRYGFIMYFRTEELGNK